MRRRDNNIFSRETRLHSNEICIWMTVEANIYLHAAVPMENDEKYFCDIAVWVCDNIYYDIVAMRTEAAFCNHRNC